MSTNLNVDPMKKSSIYATFGKYYGNKLYKLLYDCCEGTGSFCQTVKDCLGISATGNPNLTLNQQGEWVEITPTIEVTYTELITAINAGTLVPNAYYEFDFTTVHYVQDMTVVGSEDIHTGVVERMRVKAISTTQLFYQLESLDFSTDIIYWTPTFADGYYDAVAGQSTGVITYREDVIKGLVRDFDWRNVVFRRWESDPLNPGVYDSLTNTGNPYFDFAAFPVGTEENVQIGGVTDYIRASIGIPYYNDNTLIFDAGNFGINNIYIDTSWLNQIENGIQGFDCSVFLQNKIGGISYTHSQSITSNEITGGIEQSSIINMANNTGDISISSCQISVFNTNTSTGAMSVSGVIANIISDMDFAGYTFQFASGNRMNACVFGGNMSNISFSYLNTIVFVNPWQEHTFLTTVSNMTLTATASIQSGNQPTASRTSVDQTQHFQEELDALGTALTWTLIS